MPKDAGDTSQEDQRESNDFTIDAGLQFRGQCPSKYVLDAAHTTTLQQDVNMVLLICEERVEASPGNNAGTPLDLMAVL
eukprot:10293251-Prorocentrum_lima.AAC.1